jgi:hypothetical protein
LKKREVQENPEEALVVQKQTTRKRRAKGEKRRTKKKEKEIGGRKSNPKASEKGLEPIVATLFLSISMEDGRWKRWKMDENKGVVSANSPVFVRLSKLFSFPSGFPSLHPRCVVYCISHESLLSIVSILWLFFLFIHPSSPPLLSLSSFFIYLDENVLTTIFRAKKHSNDAI